MAGGHHGPGVTYAGLTLHAPKTWHTRVATAMGAMTWFWIFYRFKQDGAVLMGKHPWEAHGHHDHHDHAHGHAQQHQSASS
eukprot:jgi/Chlat1/1626/Chrsp127S01944